MKSFGWLLASLFTIIPLGAAASEEQVREDIVSEVRHHLAKDDFAALEGMHRVMMNPAERTPSGTWKLWHFHHGLKYYFRKDASPEYWKAMEAKAAAWQKRFPESPAAGIFRSYVHLMHAWNHRGTDYAREIKQSTWQEVFAQAKKARETLVAMPQNQRADPGWYPALMDALQLHQGGYGEFAEVFKEAMAKHPGYHGIYFTAVFNLQPKWGGSLDAIEELADMAVSVSPEGEAMYARVYWSLNYSGYEGDQIFKQTKVDWGKMRASFEAMLKQYPDAWNLNAYGYHACLAADWASVKAVAERIGVRKNYAQWGVRGKGYFDECLRFAERKLAESQKPAS